MKTLLLDTDAWDLVLDIGGNIAVASEPYALAQDVASAVRVNLGELWYDTTQGVAYTGQILGKVPNLQFIKSQVETAALSVPGIVKAKCSFAQFSNNVLTGQVLVTDANGIANNVSF
jgi:hypothetical protein